MTKKCFHQGAHWVKFSRIEYQSHNIHKKIFRGLQDKNKAESQSKPANLKFETGNSFFFFFVKYLDLSKA